MGSSKVRVWIDSARPKTLPAAIGPVVVGAALAYGDGFFDAVTLAVTLLCAVLIQVGTNLANDYYDFVKGADTAERVGPVRATQAGLVSPRQMRNAFVGVFAAACLLGAYLVVKGGWPIAVIGVVSIVCAVAYTAGPLAIAYVGLGEVFVLVFFGPVAVGGTYYLLAGGINQAAIIAGLGPGLLSTAILAVNNFRDIETDKAAGKKTLAVRFGYGFGRAEYIFCVVVGCLVPMYLSIAVGGRYFCNLAAAALPAAVFPIRTVCARPSAEDLNTVLAQTGRVLMVYCVLFAVGWLI
jgi:1,4-dihydroxy-2-naphthoate octaprenyltransferase